MSTYTRLADGKPRFVESFVTYLDVLGVSQMATAADAERTLAQFDDAMRSAREHTPESQVPGRWFASSWFSDNLALGFPNLTGHLEHEFLASVAVTTSVQLEMALRGFFCRGGLALGAHFQEDSFCFGPALVHAVKLEHKTRMPRVQLSSKAKKIVRDQLRHHEYSTTAPQSRFVWAQSDDVWFLNYLQSLTESSRTETERQELLSKHGQLIRYHMDVSETDEGVLEKYEWLAGYHNAFCLANNCAEQSVRGVLPLQDVKPLASYIMP